ncbi:MAG: hypothetical protein IID05_06785 [Gemmatimonadetes bacterium]|nr:hypothetical protein [Gemmatimonadota bacterium]
MERPLENTGVISGLFKLHLACITGVTSGAAISVQRHEDRLRRIDIGVQVVIFNLDN